MSILQSKIYQKDIEKVLKSIAQLEILRNKKILITGATGLVCSAIVDLLISSNLNITIYAAGRSECKVKKRFADKVKYIRYDATKSISFDIDIDIIIHGASNATPNLYVEQPIETMLANITGIYNLLEYSRLKNIEKVIYISSSEIYGNKEKNEPFKETQYGYVDLLSPRSSYSVGKRAAETMCASYKSEYGIDFNIVRLGHIYGPSANINDRRISSDFMYKSALGESLILKSDGRQMRSYCYSLDCASAILTVLIKGVSGEAYNISNKNSVISIRQMAEYCSVLGNVGLKFDLPSKNEALAFNPMDNSSLDGKKIEILGWHGLFDAKEGILHTIQILKEEL